MNTVSKYASMVKFSHTIFAMPFALTGYVYALVSTSTPFDWFLLVKVLLCMVLARNTAMGFNRWADRKTDAENPRTANREIPSGEITPKAALWFVIVNAVCFLIVAAMINRLTLTLAPVALFVIMSYSYTKRFTSLAHIVLGASLSIAPVGAYIAVTGSFAVAPVILAGLVLTWVSGFDIIYAMQDAEFDRTHGLHSIPAKLPGWGALLVSILLHLITVYTVILLGMWCHFGIVYWIGAALFIALLVTQHILVTPTRQRNIGIAFGTVNGCASIVYATFTIVAMFV